MPRNAEMLEQRIDHAMASILMPISAAYAQKSPLAPGQVRDPSKWFAVLTSPERGLVALEEKNRGEIDQGLSCPRNDISRCWPNSTGVIVC